MGEAKKEKPKTLANCTDIEFLRQTNKIRHAVEEWLTVTDIQNIRKRMPEFVKASKDADKAEREAVNAKNEELKREQARKNLDAILDACLEDHPEETLEVIHLCCFVEPGDHSHPIPYYMGAFAEMFENQEVLDFFTSLVNLARRFGLTV